MQADLTLGERDLDLVLPELRQHGPVELGLSGSVVGRRDPRLYGHGNRRIGQGADTDAGRWILQNARVLREHVANDRKRPIHITVVGDPYDEVELSDRAVVVQDLADDLAVRDDDARPVGMEQRRREQLDRHDVAVHADQLDVLAYAKGLGENDREPRHHVAQHALERDTNAQAGDADAGDQWSDLEAELVERHDAGEEDDDDLDRAHDELPQRRLDRPLLEPVIGEATDPAGGDRADGQDGEGPQHLESVTDQKIEDEIGRHDGQLLSTRLRDGAIAARWI